MGGDRVPVIRAARATDAAVLTDVALRSKAHWGYSAEFMAACRDELAQPPEKIESEAFHFAVAEVGETIAGFYAIEMQRGGECELEALFVLPEHIGTGVGRALMARAKAQARALGARSMVIQSDPHAEAFYRAAGGVVVDQRESDSIPGRMLPVLRVSLV